MSQRSGRQFAQIQLSIWEDDDFADLDARAQRLYFALLTNRTLSLAGVADWYPKRLAARVSGETEKSVRKSADDLRDARFVFFDEDTDEALLRTFVRHDKVMAKPKVAVGMVRDYSAIASVSLRRIFIWELHRLRALEPDLAHWDSATTLLEKPPVDPSEDPSVNPSVYPTGNGMGYPKGYQEGPYNRPHTAEGIQQTSDNNPQTTDSNPGASAPKVEDLFDIFWDAYDKKTDKKKAEQKFKLALKKPGVTAELLIGAARTYVDFQKRDGKHPAYTKNPATWLNGECWNDERASATTHANPEARAELAEMRYRHQELNIAGPPGTSEADDREWFKTLHGLGAEIKRREREQA